MQTSLSYWIKLKRKNALFPKYKRSRSFVAQRLCANDILAYSELEKGKY